MNISRSSSRLDYFSYSMKLFVRSII